MQFSDAIGKPELGTLSPFKNLFRILNHTLFYYPILTSKILPESHTSSTKPARKTKPKSYLEIVINMNLLYLPCILMQAEAGNRPSLFFLPPRHGFSRKLKEKR